MGSVRVGIVLDVTGRGVPAGLLHIASIANEMTSLAMEAVRGLGQPVLQAGNSTPSKQTHFPLFSCRPGKRPRRWLYMSGILGQQEQGQSHHLHPG